MSEGPVGKTIGKYRVIEQIGRGGMAEVYKAYQPGLDRYVAIKLMHTFLVDDEEFAARFQREARVVANMRHPNVVQVHDFDVESDVSYMVMEYINGETLKERLTRLQARGEWLSFDEVVRIVLAVGSALKYAHRLGMVHRDVKPANVMIDRDGQVILTDFGIAKILHGAAGSQLTASGSMVGTPSYISPEQGLGQPGDERSDIYSLGVMLYQLATGRLPYEADTPMAVVIKHIQGALPMPRSINPAVPESIERIILRALAKEPSDRYQNVGDMMTDLKSAMGIAWDDTSTDALYTRVTPAVPESALTPPPQARSAAGVVDATRTLAPKRSRGLMALIVVLGLAFVIVAVIGIALLLRGAQQPAQLPPTDTPSITETAAPTPTASNTPRPSTVRATVLEDKAELYAEPEGAIVGLLPVGVQLTARARAAAGDWIRVETPDGTTGWVKTNVLDLGDFSIDDIPEAVVLLQPSPTPNQTATQAACKPTAELAEDVTMPDGAQVKASEKFTKTWRVRNVGDCAFDVGSTLVYKSGDRMGGPEEKVEAPLVKPGETGDVSIGLVAPPLGGRYTGVWELQRANGDPIGELSVTIVVLGPTATPLPTRPPLATTTPAGTPTPDRSQIGPVGSGELEATWGGGFYNCVPSKQTDTDGNDYWVWEADFYIDVHGGNAGYTNSSPACRWDFNQQKYVCRWGAREDGAVLQSVTISCPGCKPVTVNVQASAQRKKGASGDCSPK